MLGHTARFTDVNTPLLRRLFLTVATLEAISWACLLIGMWFKYLADDATEVGVQIFGPIHGFLFVAYLLACVAVRRPFGWTGKTFLIAAACAVPPFFTALFELAADRLGLLGRAAPVGAETATAG